MLEPSRFSRESNTGTCKKNSSIFEFSLFTAAHRPRQPMHSPSAQTRLSSPNLGGTFFARPFTVSMLRSSAMTWEVRVRESTTSTLTQVRVGQPLEGAILTAVTSTARSSTARSHLPPCSRQTARDSIQLIFYKLGPNSI